MESLEIIASPLLQAPRMRFPPGLFATLAAIQFGCSGGRTADASDSRADVVSVPADIAASCNDLVAEISAAAAATQSKPGTCSTDSDCVLITPQLACDAGGPVVQLCPFAASSNVATRFASQNSSLTMSFCASNCAVGGEPQCKPVSAACVQNTCLTIVQGGDGGCIEPTSGVDCTADQAPCLSAVPCCVGYEWFCNSISRKWQKSFLGCPPPPSCGDASNND